MPIWTGIMDDDGMTEVAEGGGGAEQLTHGLAMRDFLALCAHRLLVLSPARQFGLMFPFPPCRVWPDGFNKPPGFVWLGWLAAQQVWEKIFELAIAKTYRLSIVVQYQKPRQE